MESPALNFLSHDGLELAWWEWPGDGPALIFAHATGFHGRCWDVIARDFPGRRRIAVDFRGHGRSSKPDPPYHWTAFGHDLAAVCEALGISGATAVGHSMGGHSIVAAAARRPESFARMLLLDPTIFPRAHYSQPPLDVSFILRRRNLWSSADEMFERFRNRAPFSAWLPQVLRDYCEYGLLPQGDGFVLACPPPVEASIYGHSNAPDSDLYEAIPGLGQKTVILRADGELTMAVFDTAASPTPPTLAACFRHAIDVPLPGRDHFFPMQAPELVTGHLRALLLE